jgi:Tol biopolymer transport system component
MGHNWGPVGIYIENQLFYRSQGIEDGCGYAWSPAGDFMVVPHTANSLYRITLADTTAAPLVRSGSGSMLCHPAFSPSGDRITFHERHHGSIWVVAADGSNPHRVTTHQNPGTRDQMARWSPDGQWLAFMRLGRGRDVNFDDEWGAWIIRADGTGERQIRRFQSGWRSMIWVP